MNCYCGSPKIFEECCHLYLSKQNNAPTALTLMRSRYSAFATKKMEYILETHDPQTIKNFDLETNKEWADKVQFVKLEIINVQENFKTATVEFKASFLSSGKLQIHHEVSQFNKIKSKWYYTSGAIKK